MECRICLEEITNINLVSLICGHCFHINCVIKLVEKRIRKCPLCRTRITWHKKQLVRHKNMIK